MCKGLNLRDKDLDLPTGNDLWDLFAASGLFYVKRFRNDRKFILLDKGCVVR